MQSRFLILVVFIGAAVVFAIGVVTGFLTSYSNKDMGPAIIQAAAVVTNGLGLILVASAALMLVLRAGVARPADLLPIALALVGGIMLIDHHGGVLVVFLGIVIMMWVAERFATRPPTAAP